MRISKAVSPGFWLARRDNDEARSNCPSSPQSVNVTHGGDVAAIDAQPGEFIDASASINPLGPPSWLRQEIERSISALGHYPDPQCLALRRAISTRHDAELDHIVVGNGSSELFAWLPIVVDAERWIVPVPSYGEYRRSVALAGRELVPFAYGPAPEFVLDWSKLEGLLEGEGSVPTAVILGHPNNPTGTLLDVDHFERCRQSHPEVLFVVDEAFADFCDGFSSTWRSDAENLIVLRSLTKNLAIPGLRLGYALTHPGLAERFRQRLPPWAVNLLAQRVGVQAFEDVGAAAGMRAHLAPLKAELVAALRELQQRRVIESAANWVLLELNAGAPTAREVARRCREQGVALRVCDDFEGLEGQWLRISLRNAQENQRVVDALGRALGRRISLAPVKRRPRAIMLQGCSSDAGKSLLVTALCRCLAEDGYRVAPFKAQNMSNNSGVASNGGELGRAQIVQALACGLEPDTRMNPVLLKPTSERGSQVVVRGRVLGQRDVSGYIATRQYCLNAALESFDSLASDFDVIVCEGAGSAGEMNLRRNDIVNMGFVEHREMPVVLVGDIDRGGVYASFVGHLAVMSEADRARVRGFIVNQFRGDASLLADAHRWIERHTNRPVLGVVPYLTDLRLPKEDRLSLDRAQRHYGDPSAPIRIGVIVPPHVSNVTDLDPLLDEPDVQLYLVERAADLGTPDVVLVLGSKSTIADLVKIRESGLERAIIDAYCAGAEIVGICGGLQMLGECIEDRAGIEAAGSVQIPGFGLLPITTTFAADKIVKRVRARHVQSGTDVVGYEIHHGKTDFARTTLAIVDEQGDPLGAALPSGQVWGCYVHGLFDADGFRSWFLDAQRAKKGLPSLGPKRGVFGLNATFERIARVFRENVDYRALLSTMDLA